MKKLLLSILSVGTFAAFAQMQQVDMPITFDDPNVGYDVVSFGNAAHAIVADPTDPTNMVLEQTQPVGPEVWAGSTIGDSGLANPVALTATSLVVTARIWSPNAGIPILLKVEDKTDGAVFIETQTLTTMAGAWETLQFDFGNPGPNTLPFNPAATYDKISVFCDFGNAAKNGEVYYIDDIMMVPAVLPEVDLPITFEDATIDYNTVSFGNASDTILTDPTDAGNMVLRQTQPVGPETWAGTTLGDAGLISAIPFTMTDQTMSLRVWSPAAGIPVLLKVEDAADGAIFAEVSMMTTVANDWSILNYDFSTATPALDLNNTYNKVSVFCDFGNANKNGEVYYIDDVAFGPSTVSLIENRIANFAVVPNPNNGSFTVTGNLGSRLEATINVVNLQGQVVYNSELVRSELNERLSLDLASGVYLVQVRTANAFEVKRMVIK